MHARAGPGARERTYYVQPLDQKSNEKIRNKLEGINPKSRPAEEGIGSPEKKPFNLYVALWSEVEAFFAEDGIFFYVYSRTKKDALPRFIMKSDGETFFRNRVVKRTRPAERILSLVPPAVKRGLPAVIPPRAEPKKSEKKAFAENRELARKNESLLRGKRPHAPPKLRVIRSEKKEEETLASPPPRTSFETYFVYAESDIACHLIRAVLFATGLPTQSIGERGDAASDMTDNLWDVSGQTLWKLWLVARKKNVSLTVFKEKNGVFEPKFETRKRLPPETEHLIELFGAHQCG